MMMIRVLNEQCIQRLVWDIAAPVDSPPLPENIEALFNEHIWEPRIQQAIPLLWRTDDFSRDVQLFIYQAGLGEVWPTASEEYIWSCNLEQCLTLIKTFSCWKAHESTHAVTKDLEALLVAQHPIFEAMIGPPCISHCKYVNCPCADEMVERIYQVGEDYPCPMYLNAERQEVMSEVKRRGASGQLWFPGGQTWDTTQTDERQKFKSRVAKFGERTGINPWTSKRF
jgi:hypothetical protein